MFQFDVTTGAIDSYVLRLKQSPTQMFEYNEGQVLEPFKFILPTGYYYFLFGIQNLIDAVESAKHVMTKAKLDKQLAGQNSTPCMHLNHTLLQRVRLTGLMNANCRTTKLTG